MSFRPDAILGVLERHEVRSVVIGGLAATLHGAANVTFDVDVVPDSSAGNLRRLSDALEELEARVRVDGIEGGLPFHHDARTLHSMNVLNLVTKHGDLDLTFHPTGLPTFEEWDRSASEREALGVRFRLASLEDVIRAKEASDRQKDRATLPLLRVLLERQQARDPDADR